MLKPLLTYLGCFCIVQSIAQVPEPERTSVLSRTSGTPFSSSYISGLTVKYENFNKMVLRWISADSTNEYFVIERSSNLQPFETVAVLHLSQNGPEMEWRDESSRQGGVVYRIKAILKDGSQYVAGLTSAIQSKGEAEVKVYPNPVQDVLFIRSEFPSDITLFDANGKPRMSLPNCTGLQLIQFQGLEKGVYIIRVYNRVLSTLSTERIIKN